MKKQLFTISTFTGVGGFDFGAKLAGFNSLLRSDFCPIKGKVFELNKDEEGTKGIPEHLRSEGIMWAGEKGDIFNLIKAGSISEVQKIVEDTMGLNATIDVIMGGPVCHEVSNLNPNSSPDGEKNNMMFAHLEFIRLMQPKVALMEQVPPILSTKFEWVLADILAVIESWGNYYVKYKILNAIDYGSKQSRKRAIFMLVRKDVGTRPSFPEPIPYNVEDVNVRALFNDVDFYKVHDRGIHKHSSIKPFCTLTANGNYSFVRNGITTKMTIEEKKKVSDLCDLNLDGISYKDASILLGNMVQIHFAEALFNHIKKHILKVG